MICDRCNATGRIPREPPQSWRARAALPRHNDLQEATERGACAIAILVVYDLTGMIVVERSKKGPGFDYWLGEEDDDELFQRKARLEASGLLAASRSQLQARVRQKREQIRPSDHLAPGYVAVVEFGTPIACVETT